MQLISFSVTGFRSLASVADIPLATPTILTGRNDSGKSSLLDALAYLLDSGRRASAEDFPARETNAGSDDTEQAITVTGIFELSQNEQNAISLPSPVRIRRTARHESGVVTDDGYEVEREVPQDQRLRDLDTLKRDDLRARVDELDLDLGDRPKNRNDSYLVVLQDAAEAAPKCVAWADARHLVDRLPSFLYRAGVGDADASAVARNALQFVYKEIIKREEFREPLAALQTEIESALSDSAESLCHVIEKACDGLTDVSLRPDVSFRDATLSGTQILARRDGKPVSIDQGGTGRRQQVIQAIWEWQNLEIMRAEGEDQSVIVAYDEPDVSLDYERQRNFMVQVREQCVAGKVRAIVATHSVQMIDQVPLDDVIHLQLTGGISRLHRAPVGGDHDDFSSFIGQLTEQLGLSTSKVLFERCFLLVEGPSERRAFPRLFHLATGQRLQEAGIVLFDGGGNTAVLKLVKYLRDIGKPVYVIVDADSKRDQPKLFSEQKLREHCVPDGCIDYLGNVNELEELFSDQQWSDLANDFCPHQDGVTWRSGHFSPLRAKEKFSDEVKNLLRKSKPQLMVRMAEMMTHRDDLPAQLAEAFDRLMETLRNGQHS